MIKVVATKAVKKNQTNTNDNCVTITISCCGIASGVDAPPLLFGEGREDRPPKFQGRLRKEAEGSSWVEIYSHAKCIHDRQGLEQAGT